MKKLIILFGLAGVLALGFACTEADYVVAPENEGELTAYPIENPYPGLIDIVDLYTLPEDVTTEIHLAGPEADPPNVSDTSWDVYAVTIIWGDFNHNTDHARDPIDWSGTLGVNGVAWVLPIKAISFEHGQDSVLENINEATAQWRSTTQGDYDGINFLVFMKRGIDYFVEPSLTFDTEAINIAWPTGKLRWMNEHYRVGDNASLGIHARQIKRVHCPIGMMAGHWLKDAQFSSTGHLEGLWLNAHGEPIGIYSGRFWKDHDGLGQFHGSVSGYVTDQVIAEFAGHWEYNDPALCPTCGERAGLYKGRVKWLERDAHGVMWGAFGRLDTTTDPEKLPMAGTWRVNCSDATANLTD